MYVISPPSGAPVPGEADEAMWQSLFPPLELGESSLDFSPSCYYTFSEDVDTALHTFTPELCQPGRAPKSDGHPSPSQFDLGMELPKSLSPDSDISQDCPTSTTSSHFLPEDPTTLPQRSQIHGPVETAVKECHGSTTEPQKRPRPAPQHGRVHDAVKREYQECDGNTTEPLTKSRKTCRTEAYPGVQTGNSRERAGHEIKPETEGGEQTRVSFACPFQKRYSFKHHDCLKYELRRVKDVKQHVYRRHRQPDYYCACCFLVFKTGHERDSHARNKDCANVSNSGFEGITEAQRKDLNKSPSRGLSPEDQWFRMWDIIFPGQERPDSVRVGGYMEEMVPLLRSLWTSKNGRILAEAQKTQDMELSGDLLNSVMESIFECLGAEVKRTHESCSRNQQSLVDQEQSPMAATPSRFFNEPQQLLFDEPDGLFTNIAGRGQ